MRLVFVLNMFNIDSIAQPGGWNRVPDVICLPGDLSHPGSGWRCQLEKSHKEIVAK
jgi:hypothetical protein